MEAATTNPPGTGAAPIPGSVATLREGMALQGAFACVRKDRLLSRHNQPYLALELRDRTGAISARAFRDADRIASRFEAGDAIEVRGKVGSYRGELVAEIDDARKLPPESVDPARFLPSAYRPIAELEGFLEHLTREVHHQGLRDLVERVLADPAVAGELRRAPCTRSGHHAYLGGLLEHTVAVGILAGEVCQLHPRLNPDLLMAAALLHDVGKTREFTYGADFGISEEGAMLGHVAIGASIVSALAGELEATLRNALLNCILSHHGADPGQAGSHKGFATPEALALYRINSLDAGVKGALEGPRRR